MSLKTQIKKLTDERWNVGFIQNSTEDIINGSAVDVKWIIHKYKDSWFADPFVLDVTEKEITLLVEEFYKPINRGRISKLTVDRKTYILLRCDVILELPTHLSFPLIIRRNSSLGDLIKDIDTENEKATEPNVISCRRTEKADIYTYIVFPRNRIK